MILSANKLIMCFSPSITIPFSSSLGHLGQRLDVEGKEKQGWATSLLGAPVPALSFLLDCRYF